MYSFVNVLEGFFMGDSFPLKTQMKQMRDGCKDSETRPTNRECA